VNNRSDRRRRGHDVIKRGVEASAAAMLLVALSPLFAFAALAVRVTSKGPVFHRARRVGAGERLFSILKFRTMVAGADRMGPGVTGAADPRITNVGSFLRRTKLDELPQLVNVLRGDMGFVGPRPEDPQYIRFYTPEQRLLLQLRPGITSLASLEFGHEEALLDGPDWEQTYVERILPAKLELELQALRARSLLGDLAVIGRTALRPFRVAPGPARSSVQTELKEMR
jgi:lipopolysaccharide/colanic/teichoic acid biosynthesis glycosyltransferase